MVVFQMAISTQKVVWDLILSNFHQTARRVALAYYEGSKFIIYFRYLSIIYTSRQY
jgi:hypothetical protein